MELGLLSSPDLPRALRQVLLDVARQQDQVACEEAARTPYWAPLPISVAGHRQCAEVLRSVTADFARPSEAPSPVDVARTASPR